jgi:predicted nucleotidyltransferase
MKYGLPESAIEKIHSVFSAYPEVERAILYGSRAKNNYSNGSDIDLTLIGSEHLSRQVMFRIIDDLEDLLLPYKFDLSLYEDIDDPEVIDHIKRVGITFYTRKSPTSKPE